MISDLEKLQRIRDIPDNAVKQLDDTKRYYEISAQSDKHNEVFYLVSFSIDFKTAKCTCKDFMFRNTEEKPDYECKHIGKVRDLLLRTISN